MPGDGGLLEAHLSRHARPETTPFAALNTAFIRDGALVYVPADTVLDRPVHLLFVTSPDAGGTVAHPRNLVVVERGAKASVVESYVSLAEGATYFTNAVTEVFSGESAWTEHTRIQRESERAYHVGLTHVDQARGSHYRSFTLAMGGAIARHNLHVRLNAPGIETLMYGLYLTRGEQVVDNHTAIYHDHPECKSWEVYKGVLDDRSRAVFNGKVFVKPEAQKTDAKQTNRNLLLSTGAKVDTKPQLEIFADDVKCTHGATVGFSGPGGSLLPSEPRNPRGGRAKDPHLCLRGRGGQRSGARAGTAGAGSTGPRTAWIPGLEVPLALTSSPCTRQRRLPQGHGVRPPPAPRGVPHTRNPGQRQAAGVPRQRGDHAEASGGDRCSHPVLLRGERQHPSWCALPEPAGDGGV